MATRPRTLRHYRHETSHDAIFTIGPYTFRPSLKLLLNPKGSKVRLTERETSVLRYLYRASQRPVSRETLLQQVWGYIYRLRQKIEKDAAAPAMYLFRVVDVDVARDGEPEEPHCPLPVHK